jgi:hypothetical protein
MHNCRLLSHTASPPKKKQLLDVKWEAYGMKLFLVQEAWYLQHLLIYTIDLNLEDNQPGNACHDSVSWILRRVLIVLSIFNTLVQFLSWAMQIYHGKVKTVKSLGHLLHAQFDVGSSISREGRSGVEADWRRAR